MVRKIFSIWSVLLVLVISLAVLVPGCDGGATTGTIEVKATLDGSPWPSSGTGAVDYTLTGPGTSPTGTDSVPKNFTVDPGSWNCTYNSGGPAAAYLVSITPSPTQSVAAGDTITFTLNFATYAAQPLDASVQFDTWTINGTPVAPGLHVIGPNTIVDARYTKHVSGASGAHVTVTQDDELMYHYKGPGEWTRLHVVNAWGAVKTSPPSDKLSQQATVGGNPVSPCDHIEVLKCTPIKLDVHTKWKQVVCVNYTKTINWIGFPSPPDILFDADIAVPGESFNLTTRACVTLEDHPDVNPANDCTGWSDVLTIIYMP